MKVRTALAALVACALATPVALSMSASEAEEARAATPPGENRWLTLVTGDRLLIQTSGGQERVVTERHGKGRDHVRFLQRKESGDLYVVPDDAAPLVAAGRVDGRLFNVSKLLEFGYDDRATGSVRLIVAYGGAQARSAEARVTASGARVASELPSVGGDAIEVSKKDASGFWGAVTNAATARAGVRRIWLDGKVTASLDTSVPQVGAPAAWQAGHTGKDTTVAVLDTGIDTDHPDLADAVVGARDFTGSESGADDRYGHGTHVAGIVTGDGAASGGKYKGVAPDAKLLNGKVLDDAGDGFESWIIAGMQWAAEQGVDVINMSLGGESGAGVEPMDQAVDQLTRDTGTLFVIAAGNSGPEGKVASPGSADEALTVGAVDKRDAIAEFSNVGPRLGDQAVKPDITAPGVDIVAPLAKGAVLSNSYPVVDGQYLQLPGTSMATPHVAGAAAILAGQHPDWDADELKPALMGSAKPNPDLSVYQQGAGRLDVARAVSQPIVSTLGSISNGVVRWPHSDDEPISDKVGYRNLGSEPMTLDLAVDVRGPTGAPAPAGMFTLDPARVTVPAGGTASVKLVTDTTVDAPDGVYGGTVVATGGDVSIRTPVGVVREEESYDVKLSFVDANGEPAAMYFASFIDLAVERRLWVVPAPGTVTTRVPKGRYLFEANVWTERKIAILSEPEVVVDRDLELVVDARRAKPLGLTLLDRPDATLVGAFLVFDRRTAWGGHFAVIGGFDNLADISVMPSATTASMPEKFTMTLHADLARPDGQGGFDGSPYLYKIQWAQAGRVTTNVDRRIRDRDLATVHSRIAAAYLGQRVVKNHVVELTAPATITEYYSPGMPFEPSLDLPGDDGEDIGAIGSAPVTYKRGKPVVERWNAGVFGPSFPGYEWSLARREEDWLGFDLHMFGDQGRQRSGSSSTDTARLVLSRDGVKVGEEASMSAVFPVPAERATYRLEAAAKRSVSPLSTEVSATWTFSSARPTDGSVSRTPLMAVRFAPKLDDLNRAPAGRRFAIPVHVQWNTGSEHGKLTGLTVDASYDDGKTWQRVRLAGSGVDRLALLDHPTGSGHVSLKASAVDSNGNAVEQTILRAYALS
ncbi:S8 family peptidase [Phytohabitans aurantiacus]|uniref:Serine protease n=1 Tax=Phytohabitans aurantiacus TaxID=3016789 RepID=A0ABQ5QZQ9_9ACTN|nr:S8 family peptidase [Phytohabitans aurantiacus]GLH99985.1 serine protease [Phytohabitans aurantiacus]